LMIFPFNKSVKKTNLKNKMIFFMWFICHFFSKEVQRSLQNFLEQWNIFIALINKNKIIGCYESFWKFTFFSHNKFIKLLLNSKLIKIYFGIIIWFFHYNQICKEVNWSFIIIKKY
jgi:FlaA1/EpsC-like NDP-sugar epimerase